MITLHYNWMPVFPISFNAITDGSKRRLYQDRSSKQLARSIHVPSTNCNNGTSHHDRCAEDDTLRVTGISIEQSTNDRCTRQSSKAKDKSGLTEIRSHLQSVLVNRGHRLHRGLQSSGTHLAGMIRHVSKDWKHQCDDHAARSSK